MWLPISFLFGFWMTIGTFVESNVWDCASEKDSCLKSIIRCSEFRVPLSVAKSHTLKLFTKTKDLKIACKKEAKFIRCMQSAKEICRNRPSSREIELLRSTNFAEQLCENPCRQTVYLEHANCINRLLPEAADCLAVGIKNAEKTSGSSDAMCRLQTSAKDCLVQITRTKCGFIAADIQKRLFSFEKGVDFTCYDFEERFKNAETDSCDSSSGKYESKESVRLFTNVNRVTLFSGKMENLLNSASIGPFPASVLQDAQSHCSSKDQRNENLKLSKESTTFTETDSISKVDTSTLSPEAATENEIPITAETSLNADSFPSKIDASAFGFKYPTASDELNGKKVLLRFMDNAILIAELLLDSTKSLNSEALFKSKHSKAKDVSSSEESFKDMRSNVNSISSRVDIKVKADSAINTETLGIPEEASSAKMNSESSRSEACFRVSSTEHKYSDIKSTAEMYKRGGDIHSFLPPVYDNTHENITTFSLFLGWSKRKYYVGCGSGKILWKNDSPLRKLYCGSYGPEYPDSLFKCTIRIDVQCAMADGAEDPGLALVIYGQERNSGLEKIAVIEVDLFKSTENVLPPGHSADCEKRQMNDWRNRLGRIHSVIAYYAKDDRETVSGASKKKTPLSHRSGLLLHPCTGDVDEKQDHERLLQCFAIDYVLIGKPYYPLCNERIQESEDNVYYVKASVKIEGAIRLKRVSSENV